MSNPQTQPNYYLHNQQDTTSNTLLPLPTNTGTIPLDTSYKHTHQITAEQRCRHSCGCRDRLHGTVTYNKLCASKGARYEHEQNPSLHPNCSEYTDTPCYQYINIDYKPRLKQRSIKSYLPQSLLIDTDKLQNNELRKKILQQYRHILDLQYQLQLIHKQASYMTVSGNYYSSSDITSQLELIRRQQIIALNELDKLIQKAKIEDATLVTGDSDNTNNNTMLQYTTNNTKYNTTNNITNRKNKIQYDISAETRELLEIAQSNSILPLLPARCKRHVAQHRKCPIDCESRWNAVNMDVPDSDTLKQIDVMSNATLVAQVKMVSNNNNNTLYHLPEDNNNDEHHDSQNNNNNNGQQPIFLHQQQSDLHHHHNSSYMQQ